MVKEEDVIKAAETIKEWCHNQWRCCECPFVGEKYCGLKSIMPSEWKIHKPRRWSDADVALASALIKNGYEMISSVNDCAFSIIGKNVDAICLSNGVVFKPFKVGEIVMLEDIVKEGEQR